MDTCSWWGKAWLNETQTKTCGDPWSSRGFAHRDVSFVRVTFDMNRADHTLALRYVTGVRIHECTFLGGGLFIAGPSRDILVDGSTFLGSGEMNAGGCCAIFFPTGYTSDVVIVNNTVDHLRPLDQSSFPGRLLVAQAYTGVERMLVKDNLVKQAGPGGLCDHNMGEQLLFETDAFRGAAKLLSVDPTGASVTVEWLEDDVRELLASRHRGLGDQSELWPVSGFNGASSDPALMTLTINKGKGSGQTRRVVSIGDDDATLVLDQPLAVLPDLTTSGITLSNGLAVDVIVRDNVHIGIPEHVDGDGHVATVLGFLWGNSHRFTYANNAGRHLRQVFSLMPSNNSTQTDSIFLDTTVVHARTSISAAVPLNFGFQPFFGVGFRNVTVSNIVESAIETSCVPFNYDEMLERPSILVLEGHSTCESPPTGSAVVEDAVFSGV